MCEKGERQRDGERETEREKERERERERERVCNVLLHQLGMANITSTAIRLMLPSISLMEMRSAYKAAKHFSSGNALSLTKLPSISVVEMCSAYQTAKHFSRGNALSLKLPVNSLFELSSAVKSAKQYIFNCSIKVHEQYHNVTLLMTLRQ